MFHLLECESTLAILDLLIGYVRAIILGIKLFDSCQIEERKLENEFL